MKTKYLIIALLFCILSNQEKPGSFMFWWWKVGMLLSLLVSIFYKKDKKSNHDKNI